MSTTAQEMSDFINEMVCNEADSQYQFETLDEMEGVQNTVDFKEGMMMTSDAGFTITLGNGDEFQVTVVRSR